MARDIKSVSMHAAPATLELLRAVLSAQTGRAVRAATVVWANDDAGTDCGVLVMPGLDVPVAVDLLPALRLELRYADDVAGFLEEEAPDYGVSLDLDLDGLGAPFDMRIVCLILECDTGVLQAARDYERLEVQAIERVVELLARIEQRIRVSNWGVIDALPSRIN